MPQLVPGSKVDRYEVVRLIGAGGMAEVYLVRHETLGSLHALKLLTTTSPSIRERLIREGRVQSGLSHPNVLPVVDVVMVGGHPALVMPYVEGPSLGTLLAKHRMDLGQAHAVAAAILRGVAAAHRGGFVHRDLKPENVLLALEDGVVVPKVADFGLVKALRPEDQGPQATRGGVGFGTPLYMAPEQWRDSSVVGPQADVFSLGVMLFEMVAGRRPFEAADPVALGALIAEGPRPDLPGVPWVLAEVVGRALSADAASRYRDAGALLEAWAAGAPSGPVSWPASVLALFEREQAVWAPREDTPATWTGETMAPEGPDWGEEGALIRTSEPVGLVAEVTPSPPPGAASSPGGPSRRAPWLFAAALGACGLLVVVVVVGMGVLRSLAPAEPPATAMGADWLGVEPAWWGLETGLEAQAPHWTLTWAEGRLVEARRVVPRGGPDLDADSPEPQPWGRSFRYDEGGVLREIIERRDGEADHHVGVERGAGEVVLRHQDAAGEPDRQETSWLDWPGLKHLWVFGERHRLDALGRTAEVRWLDAEGQPMAAGDGSFGYLLERDDEGRLVTVVFLDRDGRRGQGKAGIVSVHATYADPRFPWKITSFHFQGIGGVAVTDGRGAARLELAYDDAGRLAERRGVDPRGESVSDGVFGCSVTRWIWRDDGREVRCEEPEGGLSDGAGGWARLEVEDDARGLPVRSSWFQADGRPAAGEGLAAVVRYERRDDGRLLGWGPAYGVGGEVVPLDDGAHFREARVLDDLGSVIEQAFLDAEGKPMLGASGVALMRYDVDAGGRSVVTENFDASGGATSGLWGYHRIVRRFSRGLEVEQRLFDNLGRPTLGRDGFHRRSVRYDARGLLHEEAHFGLSDEPVLDEEYDYHRGEQRWDDRGRLVSRREWDAEGQPLLNPQDVYESVQTWDARGHVVEMRWLDADGQPMIRRGWGASARTQRDDQGREVRVELFGVDGEPVAEGCAVVTTTWDVTGRVSERSCVDRLGRRALVAPYGKCWRQSIETNARGQKVRLTCEVAEGHKAPADVRYRYGVADQPTEAAYFDSEGRAAVGSEGVHRAVSAYDGLGRVIDRQWFDGEGQLVVPPGKPGAHVRYTLDTRGRVAEERYFDVRDEPPAPPGLALHARRWDVGGELVDERYEDAQGALVVGPEGFARRHVDLNPDGTVREELWFDAEDQAMEAVER